MFVLQVNIVITPLLRIVLMNDNFIEVMRLLFFNLTKVVSDTYNVLS